MAEEAVAIARAEGDADALVRGLQALWMSRFFRGQRDGLEAISQEQLQIATAQGDLWSLALSEASIASLRFDSDPPAADAQLRSAVEHARQTENPFAIAFVALSVAPGAVGARQRAGDAGRLRGGHRGRWPAG